MTKTRSRVDHLGRAYAGSQLQTQIYVARHRAVLDRAIQAALSGAGARPRTEIEWTAPIESRRFAEPRQNGFLAALDLTQHVSALRSFWPTRGPSWDALAILRGGGAPGVLLVEAKSYPNEVYGRGCSATSVRSQDLIEAALMRAQTWFGVPTTSDWRGPLYQYANRLAHLFLLRSQLGIDTWLVNLCFTDDLTHGALNKSVTEDAWRAALPTFKRQLGFSSDTIPWTIDVLLPARHRRDLVDDAIDSRQ